VPTHRFWRDLEGMPTKKVLSVTEDPFPGLTHGELIHGNLEELPVLFCKKEKVGATTYPITGPLHELSKRLPPKSHVYLGNSLPIRIWDQTAARNPKGLRITASRGLNGIDGQISTFLGLCRPDQENWAILGDLTTLYDLAGPWFIPQMKSMPFTIVVLNNGGGRIFEPLFPIPQMINAHTLNFKPLADLWGLDYERWETIPDHVSSSKQRIVEIV
jgi:2-succinyl-5-enolpyruvyl-6-hydroxy-3-cyclohexene-1-carboxylate synthase